MTQLVLFSARACPFAHRTRLVLAEKRLKFELVEIDLENKPAWFSSISVYGKVPALQHGSERIVESAIINEYLDEVFPSPRLLPEAPAERALARIWIDYFNTRFAPAWVSALKGTPSVRERARGELIEAVEHIDRSGLGKRDGSGPFWFGAQPSLVDFSLYPWFERWPALEQHRGIAIPKSLGQLLSWRDAVAALPSVREIENSTSYYVHRYQRFVLEPAKAS